MTRPEPGTTELPPPPPGMATATSDPRSFTRRQREQHSGSVEQTRRANRRAAARLIATPEWLALTIGGAVLLVILSDALLTFLMAAAVAALFGWLHLSTGDGVVATILVGGTGFLTAFVLGQSLGLEGGRLWWILPGVVMVSTDAAITYNQYRRRDGGVDGRILGAAWSTIALVGASATGLAWLLQRVSEHDSRVTWPWFGAVTVALAIAAFTGLLWIRRQAFPADRRRYLPGRRLLPPPR